jgi:hypothetical protein
LFDTASSEVGYVDSIWIVLLMIMSPYVVYGISWMQKKHHDNQSTTSSLDEVENPIGIEREKREVELISGGESDNVHVL